MEVKAVGGLASIHRAQLLTYLRMARVRVGLLLNFNLVTLRDGGIVRLVNGFDDSASSVSPL